MTSASDSLRGFVLRVAVVAVALTLLCALYLAREALLLIYISALLASGFLPLVRLIERQRRVPRWLAILLIYLVFLVVVVVVGLMVVPPLIQQAADLWLQLPAWLSRVQRFLIQRNLLSRRFTLAEAVERAPGGPGSGAAGTLIGAVWGLVGGVFGVVTVLILTFYILVESDRIFESFVRLFPARNRVRIATASRHIAGKVSAWLVGQLMLATVMGIIAAIGLFLLRVPYFYVLALIAAFGETVPILGPVMAGVSAVAVAASVSPKLAVATGVFFLILHQFEANVLVPKVMERRLGVSPVTVMVALLVGASLLGVAGALLAVPTAAILGVLFDDLVSKDDGEERGA